MRRINFSPNWVPGAGFSSFFIGLGVDWRCQAIWDRESAVDLAVTPRTNLALLFLSTALELKPFGLAVGK